MKILKNGSVIFNSIDNTGSTNESSLGARYAKGRIDSLYNDLDQNYYTKQETHEVVEEAIDKANLLKAMVVTQVPPVATASANIIYLVPVEGQENVYSQYKKVLLSRNPDVYTMALLGSTEVEMEDFQFATLPNPTAEVANKVYQYIGMTTEAYAKGRFYWCKESAYYYWIPSLEPEDEPGELFTTSASPAVGDTVYTPRYAIIDGKISIVEFVEFSTVAVVSETGIKYDPDKMEYNRQAEWDRISYAWVPLLERLSEYINDGDGVSPFVTEDEMQLVAVVNSTTSTQIREAIGDRREIVVTTGDDAPIEAVIYSEALSGGGAYLITADITEDTDRWDRLRPTFHAYTINGANWVESNPLAAVIDDDLTNVVTTLPNAGVAKTRYLLKVPDVSTEGYHLDEYIYTENKWIAVARDRVLNAKRNVTTAAELEAAIATGKTIVIASSATETMTVTHSYVGTNYVDLYTTEYDVDSTDVDPRFCKYRVVGAVWTETNAGLGAFVATVDETTETALKGAIDARREILLSTGDDQPYSSVVYAENKGESGAYVVCSDVSVDTTRWNRPRSRFSAYTVVGNTWTAADPVDSVVDSDLVNVVTSLPTTGVANTRYLLKVSDATTQGYHFDEYIYTDSKWIFISKDKPAPFIATIKVTSQAEIMAAVNSNSPIYIYSDITGTLWPAISAVANAFTATVRYLTAASSSGNYNVDIVSYSVVGKTWTPTQIGIALKADLEKYVPKLATPLTESTTNYLRAFKMNADGLITGTSGSYTKSDTISSGSTTSQLPSAKGVYNFVATPTEVSLTYNTSYIAANYSKCYKVADRVYMCNIAFQTKTSDVPTNTWLIRFPENIVTSGVEVYCVMHCTDLTNVPTTRLLQLGGSASFNQFFVKANPLPGSKYYFGNAIIIKTA